MVAERKKCFVGNRLIRRELIVNHHLYFTPGIVYEDILWSYQLYRHVSAILILPTITHFYEYNQNSITKLSPQRVELHVRSYTKVCIGMLKTDYERSLFVEQHLFIFWALLSAIDYNNQYASAIQARTKALLCKAKRLLMGKALKRGRIVLAVFFLIMYRPFSKVMQAKAFRRYYIHLPSPTVTSTGCRKWCRQ